MRFFSTRDAKRERPATLAESIRRGIAPDGGLYMPERIDPLPESFFENLAETSWTDLAATVGARLFGEEEIDARRLAEEALDFPIPLEKVETDIYSLELFHGPTLAFKDVGARCLARLLAWTREGDDEVTVLVATSGDTGGAVAQAFHGVEGTRVAVLYPAGKVSPLQERQFSTLGGNILALAVDGVFDDCQRLVKEAFADDELRGAMELTSANSINIGRLLPQSFYYFYAVAQLQKILGEGMLPPLICVPSGNFGNLAAGLIAKRLGLGAARFIAATNVNDVVPEYLISGEFTPRPSKETISNAMDVGNPSNFSRIEMLYDGDVEALRRDLIGNRWDDPTTRAAIAEVLEHCGYLLDPHTAVGYLGLREVQDALDVDVPGIVLSTAHPAKFREVVEPILGEELELPEALASRRNARVVSEPLANDLDALRSRLLSW